VGTAITLDVGGVELTYSKNDRGIDHGSIFQEQDRKPIHSDQISYDYFEREGEDATAMEMAFTRPLKDVVSRLDLLGFNLDRVRREYENVAESWREEMQSSLDDDAELGTDLMSFAEFRELATEHALEPRPHLHTGHRRRKCAENSWALFWCSSGPNTKPFTPRSSSLFGEQLFRGLDRHLAPLLCHATPGRGKGERERSCCLAVRSAR
jgi:hypothetical protein